MTGRKKKDLYSIGTVAEILKVLEMPDGSTSVIIQGKKRFSIREFISTEPYYVARVEALEDVKPRRKDHEFEAIVGSLKDLSLKIIKLSSNIPPETSFAVKNIESSSFLINFISSNSDIRMHEKQHLLEQSNLKKSATALLQYLSREVQMLELKHDIQTKVKIDMDQQQREYFLHQQMKTIQDELGGNPIEQEIEELKEKAKEKKWNEDVSKFFTREVEKLSRLNPAAGEYSVQFSFCQTLARRDQRRLSCRIRPFADRRGVLPRARCAARLPVGRCDHGPAPLRAHGRARHRRDPLRPAAQAGMNALGRALAARIRAHGPLALADYMAEALGHPTLGYYRRGDPLGAAGDFTTAPEISQIFGELIGLWTVDAWDRIGRPDPLLLVELGPGRGTLMADALRAARVRPGFGKAVRLHLIESSPTLRERQTAALADASPSWHGGLETVPAGPILLIANEFFDALPVRQLQRTQTGWRERMVALEETGERFRWVLGPPSPAAATLLAPEQLSAPAGAVAEISPAARGLAAAIGARLAAAPGAALIVDYGYERSAAGQTLQAVRRHAPADPLEDPGEADLTAHVDFSALAESARHAGAQAHGPVAQGDFLRRLGIEMRAERLCSQATPQQAGAIRSGLDRLIAPEEMGRLFRVMALTSPGFGPPAGFICKRSDDRARNACSARPWSRFLHPRGRGQRRPLRVAQLRLRLGRRSRPGAREPAARDGSAEPVPPVPGNALPGAQPDGGDGGAALAAGRIAQGRRGGDPAARARARHPHRRLRAGPLRRCRRQGSSARRMPAGAAPSPGCWRRRSRRWRGWAPSLRASVPRSGPASRKAPMRSGRNSMPVSVEADAATAVFFRPSDRAGHHLFDLAGYVRGRLGRLGLASIESAGVDTAADPTRWFSYRRATLAGEKDYGRLLSAIALKE